MSSKGQKKRRDRLFSENPYCRFCGVEMVHPDKFTINGKLKNPPDNLLTLEHLDSRLNKERGKHNGEERTTICCRKCNGERGKDEEMLIPIEKRQETSGRKPFYFTPVSLACWLIEQWKKEPEKYKKEIEDFHKSMENAFEEILKKPSNGINLDEIGKRVDEALDSETDESLTNWMLKKRSSESRG